MTNICRLKQSKVLRNYYPIIMIALLSLVLSSCGTTERASKPVSYPDAGAGEVIEEGVASWYGPNFHGKLTANGERYDMYGLTAAHRTLPFNTLLRVENKTNGESVVVRINDRGPFAKNRIIDLSRKAAEEIDMIGNGTAPVKLVLLEGDLENARTSDLKTATYTVQLGSFQSEEGAFELSRKIKGSRVEEIPLNNRTVYRVYYGIYIDKEEAERNMQQLRSDGYSGYVKQIEND
ncbi:MAG: septal ring lytic transglycosylase RlpA family protein [Balneolaceae bacterium]|nr:septal ring lytic transglycosylase RlpA family protein [Balneolaceae bacterium]